jgi:hypothetical protein
MKYTLKDLQYLGEDSLKLKKLMERYPDEWETVNKDFNIIFNDGQKDKLYHYIQKIKAKSEFALKKIKQSRNNPTTIDAFLPQVIQARMASMALSQYNLAIQSGKDSGKVRFSLWNGFILQKLLFEHDFERKPVSLKLFSLFWPFITQKKILIPLVNKKGIYCFYSRRFIIGISSIIGNRRCLEIGAGDGTLVRFLKQTGTDIIATDDYSWENYINYPDYVEKLPAKQSIEKYKPEVIICSWPPPGNDFEKYVFAASSVNLYIVIGSSNEFASSNRQVYNNQKAFSIKEDRVLASLLLPPDTQHAVYLFHRI